MRAIASLGCEGVMCAIASSMSPHAPPPQQGPAPIFSAATAGGITTVRTVSAAVTTLPTTPTRDAARVKGYCTDRAIFTLLRCTIDELFFFCCGSVAAHFESAATRQPRRKPTVGAFADNTAKQRPQASVLAIRAAGASQLLKSASIAPRSYGRRHRSCTPRSSTCVAPRASACALRSSTCDAQRATPRETAWAQR